MLTSLGLCLSGWEWATAADSKLPSAGSLLQTAPSLSPTPKPAAAPILAPDLRPAEAGGEAITVNGWRIEGNTVFDQEVLLALLEAERGKTLTLRDMELAIARITALYRDSGYPLARAVLPAQELREGGEVTVQVVEAVWGDLTLNNESAVPDEVLRRMLVGIETGALVRTSDITQANLFLTDLPGLEHRAYVRAGQSPGASDLIIDVLANKTQGVSLAMDNQGSQYAGRTRWDFNYQAYNPLLMGDKATVGVLSTGKNFMNLRLAYEVPVAKAGRSMGLSLSNLEYRLGDTASILDASGRAKQTTVWLQQYAIRSQQFNLLAKAQWDAMTLADDISASDTHTVRRIEKKVFELSGDASTEFLGRADHSFAVGVHRGGVWVEDAQPADLGGGTERFFVDFAYLQMRLSRLQTFSEAGSLYLAWSGQWASKNLDPSQKFSLGGPGSVRAYEASALSGDSGQFATAEWRYMVPANNQWAALGQWQAVLFADFGWLQLSKNPVNGGPNEARLSGFGVGLNWQNGAGWRARLSLAKARGEPPVQLVNANATRKSAWFDLRYEF